VIATDDKRIAAAARGFGAEIVMTSENCASGTDRLVEVARTAKRSGDIFVNIQGDEPLIPPALIDELVLTLKRGRDVPVATAAYPTTDPAEITDHNVVKVVLDSEGYALYFSRCQVPFVRAKTRVRHLKHIGIYAYRRSSCSSSRSGRSRRSRRPSSSSNSGYWNTGAGCGW
jgi:CMP-2-keto-3-deoxyoctulosonic acid synthetase